MFVAVFLAFAPFEAAAAGTAAAAAAAGGGRVFVTATAAADRVRLHACVTCVHARARANVQREFACDGRGSQAQADAYFKHARACVWLLCCRRPH